MLNTLKRSEIVRGRNFFRDVYKNGILIDGKHLRCYVIYCKGIQQRNHKFLFGVVVQKNIRNAVDRNRIKRLIRESYRLNKSILKKMSIKSLQRITLLFVYKKSDKAKSRLPKFSEIEKDLKNLLEKLSSFDLH